MRYVSSVKSHINDTQVRDSVAEAISKNSMAAATPTSRGDGSTSTSLVPSHDSFKDLRFREDPAAEGDS